MKRLFFPLVLLTLLVVPPATAQKASEAKDDHPIYYTTSRQVTAYAAPDSSRPYVRLRFREPVHVVEEAGRWLQIRTQDGARGYVRREEVSNIWIRVSKEKKHLSVYRGTELVLRVPADFGFNAFADKEKRGSGLNPDDWRTPEGVFYVAKKNPASKYYKALVLNYPNAEDAARGLKERLITESEYEAIVKAEQQFEMPPMHTELGGWIEIHGHGTGVGRNWTQGCVAIENAQIDKLYRWVEIGTPVLIE